MTEDEKWIAENAARKKLVGLFFLGLLMAAGSLAMPHMVNRFHLNARFATRVEYRVFVGGLVVMAASAYSLYIFRRK